MASTNKTPNLGLSQFQPLDKPAWLGDYNQDMSKIDSAVHNNQTKVDSMETNVNVAISSADAATKAAQAATEAAAEATSVAQNAQTTANNVSGTATQALSIAQQAQETAESAQTAVNNALPKSGGTMTGPLILSGAPTQNNQAATKAYVDSIGGGLNLVRVWADPISYSKSGQNFLINFSALEGDDCVVLFLSMVGSFSTPLTGNTGLGSTTLPIKLTNFPSYKMICFDVNNAKTPTGVAVTFSLSDRTLSASISNPNTQYPFSGTAYTGFFSMVVQRV